MSRALDLSGKKFSLLKALKIIGKHKTKSGSANIWRCVCDCGQTKDALAGKLTSGRIKSCGCLNRTNLSGRKFGKLTVKKVAKSETGKRTEWLCECSCGNQAIVEVSNLTTGHTRSCGCISRKHNIGEAWSKYAYAYRIWCNMRHRCYDKKSKSFKDYGGRGIYIEKRWHNFFNFYHDFGRARPSIKHEIDRIDNDGAYSRNNCRWATRKENANNKRSNVKITWNGATKTIGQWSDFVELDAELIRARIKRGWSAEKTLTTPSKGVRIL